MQIIILTYLIPVPYKSIVFSLCSFIVTKFGHLKSSKWQQQLKEHYSLDLAIVINSEERKKIATRI